ncbi:STAS domain-containing protein [Thiomicrorhabdus sp. ZW0627]|uniref:STAS domain-containing protein n=1 Tax=Thiomicrorhabdus sp. ZW0627 TaxID=3039774 RepID=UPI002436DF19|nr:STAS domain-containing protein [Thiomicrorhabdus sp. ZW0627]MDG6773320.1 STAS domain-containing protein [Thiomicrorhabdus sp. ZW0627]
MADTITLPENLTIHAIDSTFSELNQSLRDSGIDVIIDAKAVESIDTSGLQALLVLINSAQQDNKNITWQNTNELFTSSAEKIGLSEALQL